MVGLASPVHPPEAKSTLARRPPSTVAHVLRLPLDGEGCAGWGGGHRREDVGESSSDAVGEHGGDGDQSRADGGGLGGVIRMDTARWPSTPRISTCWSLGVVTGVSGWGAA
ncbi:MAG: hypothetical protein J2P15_12450 [Micromonosporaceae bacterium]|nr:hypothetical protein [Micromonosporaceae bacterium]